MVKATQGRRSLPASFTSKSGKSGGRCKAGSSAVSVGLEKAPRKSPMLKKARPAAATITQCPESQGPPPPTPAKANPPVFSALNSMQKPETCWACGCRSDHPDSVDPEFASMRWANYKHTPKLGPNWMSVDKDICYYCVKVLLRVPGKGKTNKSILKNGIKHQTMLDMRCEYVATVRRLNRGEGLGVCPERVSVDSLPHIPGLSDDD